MKKWTVLILLCSAQFVMVLDSTVMNVSMTTVAKDINTTITGMQAAITFYALTMAALMLTGGKLGNIFGRLRAFRIGSIVYATGSLITGLSGSLGILMFGWSLVEGLGAILVIPAIASLTAINYEGKDRLKAFAMIGGISGAAAAIGPLIGGFVTTYLSWRYVFIGETIIMAILLLFAGKIKDIKTASKDKLDIPSALYSALGMSLAVFGILQSKVWGWVRPLKIPTINGHEIAPLGISIVSWLILGGVIVLILFYLRQKRLEQDNKYPLLHVSLLKIPKLRSGLLVLMSQYLVIASIFFVIPVYLQVILGYDALKTGVKILPLSVGLILFSIVGIRLTSRYSKKTIVRIGQVLLVVGCLVVMAAFNAELKGFLFGASMFVTGAGLGLLASQLGNVIMSSGSDKDSSEVGGLQGTFQNLGSSLGTALVGSALIFSLSIGFVQSINQTSLPANIKNYITEQSSTGVQIVSASQVNNYAIDKGASQAEAQTISTTYENSQLVGLKAAMFFISVIAILAIFLSRNIPDIKETTTV